MVRSLPLSPTKNVHLPVISSYVQFAGVSAREYAARNNKQLSLTTVDNMPFRYNDVTTYEKLCTYPTIFVYILQQHVT